MKGKIEQFPVKFWGILGIMICVICVLCGCGQKNVLFQDASFEQCDLGWYVYEGNGGSFHVLSDRREEKRFLDQLSGVTVKEVEDFEGAKIQYPIYGLQIDREDGEVLEAAWSNGYCITGEGKVYRFEADLGQMAGNYQWTGVYEFQSVSLLPCIREMSEIDGEWNMGLLEPAAEPEAPERILMTLQEADNEKLRIVLTNEGKEEWVYGTHYSVQVLLDHVWYQVPEMPGRWGFPEIAAILPAGESAVETCSLKQYGSLPVGHYRLVKAGLHVEFDVVPEPADQVVNIMCGGKSGSGVIYQKTPEQIVAVTAAHVVEEENPVRIRFRGSENIEVEVTAEKIYIVEGLDLAFAVVTEDVPTYWQVQENIFRVMQDKVGDSGTEAYTDEGTAYILTGYDGNGGWKEESAEILENWIYLEDFQTHMMLVKGEATEGMSGGGLFDEQGNLLGIVCGKDERGQVAVLPVSVIESEFVNLCIDKSQNMGDNK